MQVRLVLFILFSIFAASSAMAAGPFDLKPGATESGSPLFDSSAVQEIIHEQSILKKEMTTSLRQIKQGAGYVVILFLLGMTFVYGAVHALGPGFGKTIIVSYFLAEDAHIAKGIGLGFLISLTHSLTSILLVITLAGILKIPALQAIETSAYLDIFSSLMILSLGTWTLLRVSKELWKIYKDKHHHHTEDCAHCGEELKKIPPKKMDLKQALIVATAIGIKPCAGELILLVYCLTTGMLGWGILGVVTMGLGMALVLCGFGIAAILMRRAVLSGFSSFKKGLTIMHYLLRIGGGLGFVGFGWIMLNHDWLRLAH